MENIITIELTAQEAAALQQMLHRACLQGGLEVAEACVVLNRKLTAAQAPKKG